MHTIEIQLWHLTDSPQQGVSHPLCALLLISQHEVSDVLAASWFSAANA